MKKKICVITAARSEYGLLKWLMQDIDASAEFELQLLVTGGHLMASQGNTINQIKSDGFNISYIVDAYNDGECSEDVAYTMSDMAKGAVDAFITLKPDYICVLGDRYELLPFCNAAFIMSIPIIHISGGDVTEGALDDGIRNAVTMMATYHFPGTEESAKHIARMRNSNANIWNVGEPGLEAFEREIIMSRETLAEDLGIDSDKKWILMTYHPETTQDISADIEVVKNCLDVLEKNDNIITVVTYANADCGGNVINEYICKRASEKDNIVVVPSLGQKRYLSMLSQSMFVIGNSSSGIVEAPHLDVPVVNIGKRQKGRYLCGNIFQCDGNYDDISNAVECALRYEGNRRNDGNYWGDGNTSGRILDILKQVCV